MRVEPVVSGHADRGEQHRQLGLEPRQRILAVGQFLGRTPGCGGLSMTGSR